MKRSISLSLPLAIVIVAALLGSTRAEDNPSAVPADDLKCEAAPPLPPIAYCGPAAIPETDKQPPSQPPAATATVTAVSESKPVAAQPVSAPAANSSSTATAGDAKLAPATKKPSLGNLESMPVWGKRASARVIDRLAKSDIKPEVTWDGEQLKIFYHTRSFAVHDANKTGEFSKEAHDTPGPDADGFVLTIRTAANDSAMQAVTPQTIQEPYWKTQLISLEDFDISDSRFIVRLSYGSRVKEDTLETILIAVRTALRPAC